MDWKIIVGAVVVAVLAGYFLKVRNDAKVAAALEVERKKRLKENAKRKEDANGSESSNARLATREEVEHVEAFLTPAKLREHLSGEAIMEPLTAMPSEASQRMKTLHAMKDTQPLAGNPISAITVADLQVTDRTRRPISNVKIYQIDGTEGRNVNPPVVDPQAEGEPAGEYMFPLDGSLHKVTLDSKCRVLSVEPVSPTEEDLIPNTSPWTVEIPDLSHLIEMPVKDKVRVENGMLVIPGLKELLGGKDLHVSVGRTTVENGLLTYSHFSDPGMKFPPKDGLSEEDKASGKYDLTPEQLAKLDTLTDAVEVPVGLGKTLLSNDGEKGVHVQVFEDDPIPATIIPDAPNEHLHAFIYSSKPYIPKEIGEGVDFEFIRQWLPPQDLTDARVAELDPYDPNLDDEEKARIIQECKVNPYYFFTVVAKSPVAKGMANERFAKGAFLAGGQVDTDLEKVFGLASQSSYDRAEPTKQESTHVPNKAVPHYIDGGEPVFKTTPAGEGKTFNGFDNLDQELEAMAQEYTSEEGRVARRIEAAVGNKWVNAEGVEVVVMYFSKETVDERTIEMPYLHTYGSLWKENKKKITKLAHGFKWRVGNKGEAIWSFNEDKERVDEWTEDMYLYVSVDKMWTSSKTPVEMGLYPVTQPK